MERNVMSWNQALELGYEPRLYPFNGNDLSAGVYHAQLDFKIWAKYSMAVVCYFTMVESKIKFCLSVFRTKGDEEYILPTGDIDFTTCPVNRIYKISIAYNSNNKPVLKEAILIS